MAVITLEIPTSVGTHGKPANNYPAVMEVVARHLAELLTLHGST